MQDRNTPDRRTWPRSVIMIEPWKRSEGHWVRALFAPQIRKPESALNEGRNPSTVSAEGRNSTVPQLLQWARSSKFWPSACPLYFWGKCNLETTWKMQRCKHATLVSLIDTDVDAHLEGLPREIGRVRVASTSTAAKRIARYFVSLPFPRYFRIFQNTW